MMKSPEMPQTFGLGINANHAQDHWRVNDDGKNTNPENNQPALLNEVQEWGSKTLMNIKRTTAINLKYLCV